MSLLKKLRGSSKPSSESGEKKMRMLRDSQNFEIYSRKIARLKSLVFSHAILARRNR